ncbi:TolC family outer membrane protein [Nevskia soli]|uniref:TolC family outer membrane protein n=1 Tax=Nevskia soli TaxID=418856 RepID=UPI000A059384|nr:TolC family outer membrane protein [Nevskia soli]
MRKRATGVLGSMVCVLWAAPGAVRANDLLDAYRQAQAQDTTLDAALHQRGAAIEARPQALAAFLPQLDANANFARDKISSSGDNGNPTSLPGSTAPQASSSGTVFGNSAVYALTLNQQIWSFQSFHKLAEANLQVAQAEATYRDAQQSLILRVATAYFNVLAAEDTLRTNQLEREAYGEMLRQARKRVENGLSPQTDVKEAQSFYDVTAASVIDADSALDDARRALSELTARETRDIAPLKDEIPLPQPDPARPEDWVQSALQDNYVLSAANLQAQAAQRDISANRARGLPTLSLQGSVNKYDYSSQLGNNERDDRVGVVVDWPLFQGGTVASLVRQAKNTYEQLRAQYEGKRRDIERQTHAAYRGVVSGIEKIRSNRQAADSNRDAVEASRIALEVGTRNEFSLLQAQTNYYDALRSYYQSRYDYLTNSLTLKQLAGRLSEADLGAIDAFLVRGAAVSAAPSAVSGGLSADTATNTASK